jgi:hypothetical protein
MVLVSVVWSGVNPVPADARPLTCTFSASSVLPTKSQFAALVSEDPNAENRIWAVLAPVSRSCQNALVKGQYIWRGTWTTTLQLRSGWPIGKDYSEGEGDPYYYRPDDALFHQSIMYKSPTRANLLQPGFYGDTLRSEVAQNVFSDPLEWEVMDTKAFVGHYWKDTRLTELCHAERCRFTTTRTGQFSSVSGAGIPTVVAEIGMCMLFVPDGVAGEAETESCKGNSENLNAHPGTFGMQVTVSGFLVFEPLLTWR